MIGRGSCQKMVRVLFLFIFGISAIIGLASPPIAERLPRVQTFSPRRGMGSFPDTVSDISRVLGPVVAGNRPVTVEIEVTDLHNHPVRLYGKNRKAFPGWGIELKEKEGRDYKVSVRLGETDDTSWDSESAIVLAVMSRDDDLPEEIRKPGFLASPGCRERLVLSRDEGIWTAAVVSDRRRDFGQIPLPEDFSLDSIGVFAGPGGLVRIETIRVSPTISQPDLLTQWADASSLDSLLQRSSDPLEGYWRMYDYTLDQNLLRVGGEYRLAIVADGDRYLIVYLDGARTGAGIWIPGMLKGELRRTSFPGIWDVTWMDASMQPMSYGLKAVSSESGTVITIEFPAQESRIRLRRVEN